MLQCTRLLRSNCEKLMYVSKLTCTGQCLCARNVTYSRQFDYKSLKSCSNISKNIYSYIYVHL